RAGGRRPHERNELVGLMLGATRPFGRGAAWVRGSEDRLPQSRVGRFGDLDAHLRVLDGQVVHLLATRAQVAGQLSANLILDECHGLPGEASIRAQTQHRLEVALRRVLAECVLERLARVYRAAGRELESIVDEALRTRA